MKISLSPSSSSSSLDRNLNNNNSDNVTAKCFTSIIRRFLLCSGNQLRTHPFDSSSIKQVDDRVVLEFDHQKDLKDQKIQQAPPATPGLVARLMGLDSMPNKGIMMMSTHPDSIGSSRSVNSSMDCRSEFNHKTHGEGHRRVQTCLSFRERPTFLELENDDFLLLSFENIDEIKEFGGSKGRKLSEMGCGESKQRKENGNENRGNRGEQRVFDQNKKDKHSHKRNCAKYERKISSHPCLKDVERKYNNGLDSSASTPCPKKPVLLNPKDRLNRIKHKEVSDSSKLGKKNKNRPALKKLEPECNTENSASPVSVLDIGDDFEFEQGSNSSEEESSKTGLNLIRKLTPDVLVNSDRPSIHFTRISIGEVPELRTVESQSTTESAKKINNNRTEDYIQLWGEVCMLTEEDMKTSNWMPREMLKMEELEEIGTGFGLEILNQLLHEMAAELEEFPKTDNEF